MIVVSDYRGFRIEVTAAVADGRWNAEVRMLRLFPREKLHVETVNCYNLTPDHAERSAEILEQN